MFFSDFLFHGNLQESWMETIITRLGENNCSPWLPEQGTTERLRWRQFLQWIPSNLLCPDEIITNPDGMDNYFCWV